MQKILVANRGEIALRVLRTARNMGIRTVAVYSDADRHAPHVRYADEAVRLGPAPSKDSYLKMDTIIDAARRTGAEGIHPGYGFLSENAEFARRVEAAGLTFIGPRPRAIEVMGNKLAAKDAVKDYDIPMVPGVDEAITDVAKAKRVAEDIGFPILIKAAAGGGGKGMRIVENPAEFTEQMDRAVSEAISAFGDGAVFLEKYVTKPRHIEIQVLADTHGNTVHLFERECSVQRRHQKVIEEAPSAVLTPELRAEMGAAAVRVVWPVVGEPVKTDQPKLPISSSNESRSENLRGRVEWRAFQMRGRAARRGGPPPSREDDADGTPSIQSALKKTTGAIGVGLKSALLVVDGCPTRLLLAP